VDIITEIILATPQFLKKKFPVAECDQLRQMAASRLNEISLAVSEDVDLGKVYETTSFTVTHVEEYIAK
jgi:hypothetical protein